MTGTPFFMGPDERAALQKLRELAAGRPVDMQKLMAVLKTDSGKRRHKRAMTEQSVALPFGYIVTYSVETGHPSGPARHMSMSVLKEGRVPNHESLWMVAEELGFQGGLTACAVWLEELSDGGTAVNVAQPLEHKGGPVHAGHPGSDIVETVVGTGQFEVTWIDAGREPQHPPNPECPNGINVDLSQGAALCCTGPLPYPAPRCGAWHIVCQTCGLSVAVTAAGRPDDPRTVKLPCKPMGSA